MSPNEQTDASAQSDPAPSAPEGRATATLVSATIDIEEASRVLDAGSLEGHVKVVRRSRINELLRERAEALAQELFDRERDRLRQESGDELRKRDERIAELEVQATQAEEAEQAQTEVESARQRIAELEAKLAAAPAEGRGPEREPDAGPTTAEADASSGSATLKERIAELEAQLARAKTSAQEGGASVAELEKTMADLEAKLVEAQAGFEHARNEAERQMAETENALKEQLAYLEQTGKDSTVDHTARIGQLNEILSKRSQQAAEREKEFQEHIRALEADSQQLTDQFEIQKREADEAREAALSDQAKSFEDKVEFLQQQLQEQEARHREALTAAQAAFARQMAELRGTLAEVTAERDELRTVRKRLEERVAELEETLAATIREHEKRVNAILDEMRVYEAELDHWILREEPYTLRQVVEVYGKLRQSLAGSAAAAVGDLEKAVTQLAQQFDGLLDTLNRGDKFGLDQYVELQCLERSGQILLTIAQVLQRVAAG